MRKQKTIKIDGREITVKELTVKHIRQIMEIGDLPDDQDIMKMGADHLHLVTDLKLEDMEEMAPSELRLIWEAFQEVNADFLSMIGSLGIGETLVNSIRKHLMDVFADSLNGDMKMSGTTDTVSS